MSRDIPSAHHIWRLALLGHPLPAQTPLFAAPEFLNQPGFSVYRNTVRKAYVDALEANYPTVARMVGRAWLRAAANDYALTHTCTDPRLLIYGEGFDKFLATFEPAQKLPFLASMASLDRAWTCSHIAADAPVLGPQELQHLTETSQETLHLRPHPSAHWLHHPDYPISTLWQRSRAQKDEDQDLAWVGEAILITRPESTVQWCSTTACACAFLEACQQNQNVDQACAAALALKPDADLGALVAQLIVAGALQSPSPSAVPQERTNFGDL